MAAFSLRLNLTLKVNRHFLENEYVDLSSLLMDDVVFRELSRQSNGDRSLTHSLTHSILINLLIKVELNIFSPTSLAKSRYCFCPKHSFACVWLVCQGTREG